MNINYKCLYAEPLINQQDTYIIYDTNDKNEPSKSIKVGIVTIEDNIAFFSTNLSMNSVTMDLLKGLLLEIEKVVENK